MNILIIGGAGFVGSYLANDLAKDHDVTVVDSEINGDRARLNDNITFNAWHRWNNLDKYDYVFYLACSQISLSDSRPLLDLESNAAYLLSILNHYKNNPSKRLKKILYTSSASVYGNNYPATEETSVNISSIYASTKYLAENYCNLYTKNYGVPTAIVRFSNVYGYNQTPKFTCGVIGKFINNAFNGKELTVIDADSTRDYTFIEDAVDATKLIAFSDKVGETYNISTNKGTSIRDIITELKKHYTIKTKDLPHRIIDNIKYRVIDNSKIKSLGWSPKHTIEQGIKKIIEREYSSSN